ncbi:hypothetical protein DBV15_04718 [Temnothorax longispinosus]|uniref:Uncharacterized protein n=1 Tax=Temnothorax longispinosus TaxID=300112 RepID=A0A4S2KA15_9HYME|nr:hypothetical protein DBV15_04718 [Temnothorax longispinosus]
MLLSLHLSTLRYRHRNLWLIVRSSRNILHFPHNEKTIDNSTKDNVFAVQEITLGARNEELTAVGVLAAVRHRQQTRRVVLQSEVLIWERSTAVDTQHPGAVAVDKIAALYHKVLDHSVKNGTFEAQRHAILPVFPGAKLPEVLRRFRADILEQLKDHATYLRVLHAVADIHILIHCMTDNEMYKKI